MSTIDAVFIKGLMTNLYGVGLAVTSTALPIYNALKTDVIILANATTAPQTIQLPSITCVPNQTYIIKKTDITANVVTILPAPGYTINTNPVKLLTAPNDVVYITLNGTNWEIISSINGGAVVGQRMSYSLLQFKVLANDVAYIPISYFPWLNARYIAYTSGVIIFNVSITGQNLDVRFYDATNNVVLGGLYNINTSGIKSFSVANPASDCVIELQVKKTALGGFPSSYISGVSLEYDY